MRASPRAAHAPLPSGEGITKASFTLYGDRKSGARQLRSTRTVAERILWTHLRDRRLGGYKFRRQLPIGSFFADFCCLDRKLVVELDGGQHVARFEYDSNRTQALKDLGFQVMRFWNSEVVNETERVCHEILETLSRRERAVAPTTRVRRP